MALSGHRIDAEPLSTPDEALDTASGANEALRQAQGLPGGHLVQVCPRQRRVLPVPRTVERHTHVCAALVRPLQAGKPVAFVGRHTDDDAPADLVSRHGAPPKNLITVVPRGKI